MKCPICGEKLELYDTGLVCYRHCLNGKNVWGSEETLKELTKTKQALDVVVDMLKDIDKTRSVANHKIGTQDKTLNSGIVFCWTTPDQIHNALQQIKQITENKGE